MTCNLSTDGFGIKNVKLRYFKHSPFEYSCKQRSQRASVIMATIQGTCCQAHCSETDLTLTLTYSLLRSENNKSFTRTGKETKEHTTTSSIDNTSSGNSFDYHFHKTL